MDMYRVHSVKIRAEDRKLADDILVKHVGDIDDVTISSSKNSDGGYMITFWIRPYIYEDLETIIREFKEAGIQVM